MSFALMGACLGMSAGSLMHAVCIDLSHHAYAEAEIELLDDSRESATGEMAFAQVMFNDGSRALLHVDLGERGPYLRGDHLKVSGVAQQADWEKDDYLWQNGAQGRLQVKAAEEADGNSTFKPLLAVRSSAIEAIGSKDDAHSLVQALVCGYRRNIRETASYAEFQACGLAHLVAVSGAHLVIVTSMMAIALRALRVPRRASIVVLVALMVSYLIVSGMPISAVRATIMSSVGILSLFGKRRPSALNALGVGMIAIVSTSPTASVSASFALSALSTSGIVLFAPLFQSWMKRSAAVMPTFVVDALSLTLASALLSQPYACSLFHQLPIIAPIANTICAPLFPIACGFGLFASGVAVILPVLSPIALAIGSAPSSVLLIAVGALSNVPYASIPLSINTVSALALSVIVASTLWALWPELRFRTALAGVLVFAIALAGVSIARSQDDSIIMLDVGQGDAFLVRSHGASLLIDTGNHDAQLLDQLARSGTFKINAVLITHSDDDHCGSLDALSRGITVERVLLGSGVLKSSSDKNKALVEESRRVSADIIGLDYGDVFKVGAFKASVIWPHEFSDEGGNAESVCLLLEYDANDDEIVDFRALFTGDAEKEQIADMIESGDVGDIDLLKVGHHGSRNDITQEEAIALDPEIALIGVGKGNRYGHPATEVISLLNDVGCKVYRSDEDGQVKCAFTSDSLTVSLQ